MQYTFEQDLNGFGATLLGGQIERSPALTVSVVDERAVREEQGHNVCMALGCCLQKRGLPSPVLGTDGCGRLQQELDGFYTTIVGSCKSMGDKYITRILIWHPYK